MVLLFVWFVLLHGGSQAGDPATLSGNPCQSDSSFRRSNLSAVHRRVRVLRGCRQHLCSRGTRRRISRQKLGWKLTWPSRVPLRMSCSAILKSSSTRYRSTKSRSGGSNGESDGYGGAAIGLGKSRLEDFLESQRMETARKIWKCAHQNL